MARRVLARRVGRRCAPKGGLTPRDLWSLDEYVVVADLYLRRGRSSGVHDREVLALAELTGRTPASISRRLGNFEGTQHPGRGLKPVTREALATFRAMAADAAVRERMVRDAIPRLTSGPQKVPDAPGRLGPRLVQPEEMTTDTIEVQTAAIVRRMMRAEAALVRRYRAWLDPLGIRLRAWSIPVAGETLRTDLYDTRLHLLIEAKAAATRNLLRQAVGQLVDYRRYLSPPPRLAVLLPEEPTPDLAALPPEVDIGIIWVVRDRFEDSAGGEFIERDQA